MKTIDLAAIPRDSLAVSIGRYMLRLLPSNAAIPILRGPLRGKKWIVGSSVHRCWMGGYEVEFQRVLASEIEPGGVFYDIGANVGFYSLLAASLISPGWVYAFEPVPANVSYLRSHIELNNIENIDVCQVAISDVSGPASFCTNMSGSATNSNRTMGHLAASGDITVSSTTLDEVIHDRVARPPSYIKMDIEGGEVAALRGARGCLLGHRPLLFLATHGSDARKECCELLRTWNYEISVVSEHEQDRAELIARPPS